MKQIICVLSFFLCWQIVAQQPMPGGVPGASIWEITQPGPNSKAQWKSNLKSSLQSSLSVTGKVQTINSNPAISFNAATVNNILPLGKLKTFSLFTICVPDDSLSEKVIISLVNDTAPEMVLTNQRLAALNVYKYINYNKNKDLTPKIYVYSQSKSNDSVTVSHRLQLGNPPQNQQLPVSAFNGVIPEFIFFNRFLSFNERVRVESYLALKYGISLNQTFPVSYRNSKGEIIWDAEKNASYNQNIAGIGRDDVSGLYQKISESVQTPGIMKISLSGNLNDNEFFIWGDNGKALCFKDTEGIRFLQCEWRIAAYRTCGKSVSAQTSAMALHEIDPLRPGETYWMIIDRSGTGKYPFRQTSYVPCASMKSQRDIIDFANLTIDPDSSGTDVFSIMAAPAFFTRSLVVAPTCSIAQSGTIQTEIIGGTPPYKLVLKTTSKSACITRNDEGVSYYSFEGIGQGAYILEVTDANKSRYTEKIWVSNKHLWGNAIVQQYTLSEDESLFLDASIGMPAIKYQYSWVLPDASIVARPAIFVTQPGRYLLSVTDDKGCNSTQEIRVKQTGKSNFKDIELFPNPSSGWFSVRAELRRAATLNITISTISGTVLKQTLLQNDSYYWYSDHIHDPGIYLVTLTSGTEQKTLKLVVQ